MRRNNGWLAVLAISMVLPILRHGLAGERLPLDYGNTANDSKAAYDRGSDRSGDRFAATEDSESRNAISRSDARTSETGDVGTKRLDSRERADKSTEKNTGTEILDTTRESKDSSWFFGAAIKNRSWKGNVVRQKQEPESTENGASTGNHLVSFAYRYYGHVDESFVDGEKGDRNAFGKESRKVDAERDQEFDHRLTSAAANETLGGKEVAKREITRGSKSVYSLMNNERAKSIGVLKAVKNSTSMEGPYFSFDFKLNRTEEHSSNFDLRLAFNKLMVAPLGNETLLKQAQVRDNFSVEQDFPVALSDGLSIMQEMSVLNQSYVPYENISGINGTEESASEELHFATKNENTYNSFDQNTNENQIHEEISSDNVSDHTKLNFSNVEGSLTSSADTRPNSSNHPKQELIQENKMEMNFSSTESGSLISSVNIPHPDLSNHVGSNGEKHEVNRSDNETSYNTETNSTFITRTLISAGTGSNQSVNSNQKVFQEISDNETNETSTKRSLIPSAEKTEINEEISKSFEPEMRAFARGLTASPLGSSHAYSDYNHAHSDVEHVDSNEDGVNSQEEEVYEVAREDATRDFTFDEGNVLDNLINREEATVNAAELNGGEPVTEALMLDNEVESNNEAENETDATELNATWSQLNEHGKEAKFKAAQEEGSVFKGVTKEAELLVVSPVESLVESSAYLSTKNASNPFQNSITFVEKWHVDSQITEQSGLNTSLNDLEENPNVTINLSESLKMNRSSLTRFSGSPAEDNSVNLKNDEVNATRFNGSLNGSIIASRDWSAVSRVPPNQNIVDKIKNNEPAVGFRWKNAANKAVGDGSEDNGTLNQVNPTRKEVEDIEDERSMDSRVSAGIMGSWINERFPKGRKSRSSRVSSTTASIRSDSSKVDGTATSITIHEGDRNVPEIESILRLLVNEYNSTVDHSGEAYVGDDVTFPTTEFGLQFVDVDPSITTATGNEQRSFGFDPIETNGEERANTEDGLYKVNNSSVEMEPLNQWPVKHSAVVEGDLVLGGLMMVHEREDTITCGPVMPQGGVQALEAMLYTLDRLNDREIVPGVKIGAHILDDCDKDTYGLEMAVDFIKGSISNIDGAEYHCNKTAVRKVISGVVGAASSVTSIQVANLLRLFRIPQVSFFSTSPELSNKQRFEYFTRTIPSDHYQVKAMIDIVLKMGWSYVSIIYEESNYGIKAFEELEELLGKHDICIAIKEKLVKDSGVAEETAYDNIVLKLLTKPRARGCIIFGSDQEVAGVMRAVRRCNATGAFSWIGSDGWSARGLVSNGNEPEVEGTLSVQPQANPVKGFEEYFLNLTVENNRRNPWFVEFWEDHFQCRYPNASRTPYNQKYTKPCTTKERLTKQNTAFEDQLQFVSDAVMAFAYAFRDMHRDLCHGKPGLCDAMKPTKGTELLKYLRKVDFEGLSGDKFKFDKNGDGPARYNIIHFKQIEPGKYKWIRVGKYLEGELRLNMSEIQFKLGHPQPPESVCSLPCEVGQAKKYVEGERCCWHCFNCTQYQIRHPKDETQCIPCRQGTVPDETHSTCRDIPEEFLRPESGWAIGAMSFSAVGIMITLFVCGVFLKHNDTPVVRASGRELSYVLLSGILLCYLVTFALVLRPTDIVCGIQRFAAGFCFTVVYAALLTKTNRISRIFNASKHSAKRPSFISPRSQLIICSGLVFVQILINGVWMIIDPARAMHHYPTREDNLLVCNSYVDASYMIAFAYPIMLIVVCTVYAVLTRKIPEAFNESKHIGFTMYTTCVIWLAFVPLYFGTGNNVALRITSMSVTISLSASVTIACLFSPKLYIILIRPERNVRQSMMPARYSTTKSSAVTATNASSMIAPITLTAATCDQNKAVKKHIITTIDCSTQSEYYELEVKDRKNGKPPPTVVSRSTQTSNEKDSNAIVSSKDSNENTATTKQLNNNARIGNGPVNQSDVPL